MDLLLLDVSYKWEHTICVLLCLAHFTELYQSTLTLVVMLHISESKADIPCLLTQKLQPVLGPEKIAKPPVAGCICGTGSELWSFCTQSHPGTNPPMRSLLSIAWLLDSLCLTDACFFFDHFRYLWEVISDSCLSFTLGLVQEQALPFFLPFELTVFNSSSLFYRHHLIQTLDLYTWVAGAGSFLTSLSLANPRLRVSCLIILSDGSFTYVCHLEEFKLFQHIKTCAFLPASWPFSWVSPFLFIWFLWPLQDCRTVFLPSCARPLFSPLPNYFWLPLSLCSFSILVPFNSKRRWNQYT